MEKELKALHEGRITFDQFARETKDDWTKLSQSIWKRWQRVSPAHVQLEDLRQEMLIAVWRSIEGYDPTRGVTLKRYAVYAAGYAATRWIQVQRNTLRRSPNNENRYPIALSVLGLDTEEALDSIGYTDDDPLEMIDAREQLQTRIDGSDGVEFAILQAVAEHGFAEGCSSLFGNSSLRLKQRWSSMPDVTRTVTTTLIRGSQNG